MENLRRSGIIPQSEGQESVGSRHRDEFVNLERRRDIALAQSPSIRVAPVHLSHISRSHFVSSRHVPKDQEMHDTEWKYVTCSSGLSKGTYKGAQKPLTKPKLKL